MAVGQTAVPWDAKNTSAVAIRVPDLEVIEDAVSGMPLQAARLTARRGSVSVVCLELGGMSLTVGSFDFRLITSGQARPDTVTVALPLARGEGTWNGVELDERSLWTYGPGSEHEGGARWPPTFAAITLPADECEGFHAGGSLTLRTGEEVAGLGRLLLAVAASVEARAVSPSQMPLLERNVREALSNAVEGPAPEEPRLTSSARIVNSCVGLTRQLGPNPRVATLSKRLGVSDRWIRAAFRKEYGLPPSAFFRTRNLHHAHRDLRLAMRGDTTVTDVAMKRGFWHLGRFSGLYRQCFGELPRETLENQFT